MHPSIREFGENGDIVIVDDNPANLRLLSVVLRESGHRVRTAINARIALSAIRSQHPDLVILDISMPETNGIELCRMLRAEADFVDLPVIFLSARDGIADKSEAFDLGGVDYITKPTFFPHECLRLLDKADILSLQLGDHVEREITIMFADIEGFTALAESMTPSASFALINDYLSHVGPVVREHGGFVDKYIGDAIMALFPHPTGAVDAAVALLGALAQFNRREAPAGGVSLSVGVGIHCGTVSFGILGENQRMQGTVIGDAVNVASRIDGLTRRYGAGILISEAARALVREEPSRSYRLIDTVAIRGRRGATVVWEVLAPAVVPEHAARVSQLRTYNLGLQAFHEQRWQEARACFQRVLAATPEDQASRSYLERVERALGTTE